MTVEDTRSTGGVGLGRNTTGFQYKSSTPPSSRFIEGPVPYGMRVWCESCRTTDVGAECVTGLHCVTTAPTMTQLRVAAAAAAVIDVVEMLDAPEYSLRFVVAVAAVRCLQKTALLQHTKQLQNSPPPLDSSATYKATPKQPSST